MPQGANHSESVVRLKRIEGQIRGIIRMVEDRRYCIDIIQQLTAARKALDQATLKIMNGHIHACVTDAIRKREGERKISELMQTITRFVR